MVAGGSGITPMYQVANLILKNPFDKTMLSLIYANVTEDDILLKAELDLLVKNHHNFKVPYSRFLRNPKKSCTCSGNLCILMIEIRHRRGHHSSCIVSPPPPPPTPRTELHLGFI